MNTDAGPASPLEEADPLSLQECFDRDPMGLTRGSAEVEIIVRELRAARGKWAMDEKKNAAKAAKAGPRVKLPPGSLKLSDLKINLKDLTNDTEE